MTIRGTYRHHPPLVRRPTYPFSTAAGVVRWWLNTGRDAMGSVRAIDYGRDGTGGSRDFWTLEKLHERYALVTLAVGKLDREDLRILAMAYRRGLSDLKISERLHTSRQTITRKRSTVLRAIRVRAQEHGLIQPEGGADGATHAA